MWVKGQSGNPGGRTKAHARLSSLCRAAMKQGDTLVEFMQTVFDGSLTVMTVNQDGEAVKIGPNVRERMDAAKWFADRGWGKVLDMVESEDGTPAVPDTLLDDTLEDGLGPTGAIQ